MVREGFAIILVTEPVAELIHDEIADYQARTLPAVVVVPDNTGSGGVGLKHIEDAVIKAVGANIFSESED
jgi:V/A-type H+-transporting ATPase subunit F